MPADCALTEFIEQELRSFGAPRRSPLPSTLNIRSDWSMLAV